MAAAARPSSKRPISTGLKPPTSIDSSCVIAGTAVLQGIYMVTLSANTVLHPRSTIISTHGPVTFGEGCIICEKVSVGVLSAVNQDKGKVNTGVVLGRNVTVEPLAVVEAASVGDGTTIELGAKIGKGAIIGNYCKIAPLLSIAPGEILPDYTVVYGPNERRRQKRGMESLRDAAQGKQIETLKGLIPSNLAIWQ